MGCLLSVPGAGSDASAGEVAEWSKANDSKSFEGKPSVGSNPTLSVFQGLLPVRRAVWVAAVLNAAAADPRHGDVLNFLELC